MAQNITRPPPAVDVIESEEIVQYFHPSLLHLDYRSLTVRHIIISVTLVVFSIIFAASLKMTYYIKGFETMRLKHRVFMGLAMMRGIFGFFCILIGSHALFTTTNLDRDVVFGKTATSSFAVSVTVGFFVFELAAVLLSDFVFKTFSKLLLIHHSLSLLGYYLVLQSDSNYCFGCKGLILEMSTPFSCLCFVLIKAGKERTLFWKINQFILVHSFHLRSVAECHFWWITYQNWAYLREFMPTPLFFALYTNLFAVTFIMTPYWGYKKTQQLINPVDWNFEEAPPPETCTANGRVKKIQ